MNETSQKESFFIRMKNQVIRVLPITLISIAISLAGAVVTVYVANITDNPIWKLTKDPAQVIDFPPYIGLLSNWSALLWMSAGVICVFVSIVLKKNQVAFRNYRFIFASGVLSIAIAIDDIFLLHDNVLPRLLDTREVVFYLFYFLILGVYILFFWRDISKYDYVLFITAFLLFGLSRGLFLPRFLRGYLTLNDMLKHFGIVFWLAFFYRASLQELENLLKAKK